MTRPPPVPVASSTPRQGPLLVRPYAPTRGKVRLHNGSVDIDTLVMAKRSITQPVVIPPAAWPIAVRLGRPVTPVELAGETGMVLNAVLYHLDEMAVRGLLEVVDANVSCAEEVPASLTLLERILEGVRRL